MDATENPYNPGAGTPPPALVGREKEIEAVEVTLRRLRSGKNSKSALFTGLRGVGKTVLLNHFEILAASHGYVTDYLEIEEDDIFAPRLAASIRKILLSIDAKRKVGDRIQRALGILKGFTLQLPGGPGISFDVAAISGPADSGNLADDLGAVFVELGEIARDHDVGVMIALDELQFVDKKTLAALFMGLHRAAQLSLPVTVIGAGLPSLTTIAGQARSYAERMFSFPVIGSLGLSDARNALELPARKLGVDWTPEAIARTVGITEGYPYFLQEFGKQAWNTAIGPKVIHEDDVARCEQLVIAELDDGFFKVRTGSTTDVQREYLRAMAELAPGPILSGEVARLLFNTTPGVGPIRDQLIKAGLCYAPRRNELAFTVPMFDQFMKRWIPDLNPGASKSATSRHEAAVSSS